MSLSNARNGVVAHARDEHAREVMNSILDLWKLNSATDVIITSDGGIVFCHRLILIANSDYFRTLFKFEQHKDRSSRVQLSLPNIRRNDLEAIVKYMYSGNIEFTSVASVMEILKAADFLQINCLTSACSLYLHHHIDLNNALELLEFTAVHNHEELKKDAVQYLNDHLASVLDSESLERVSLNQLLCVLNLNALLQASRKNELLTFAIKYLKSYKKADNSNEILKKVKEAVDSLKKICKAKKQEKIFEKESVLAIIPYSLDEDKNIYCSAFNRETESERKAFKITAVPINYTLSDFSVSALERCIFIIGGLTYQKKPNVQKAVLCFDIVEDKWIDVEPMNKARSKHNSTTTASKLYVISASGCDEEGIEVYDPCCKQWTIVLPMCEVRLSLCAGLFSCSTRDGIYWVHKFFFDHLLASGTSTMVKYDVITNKFLEIRVSSVGKICSDELRRQLVVSGCCVVQDEIVLMISCLSNYMDRSTTVYKPSMLLAFDPLSNTVRLLRDFSECNEWEENSLNFMAVTAGANKLLCLGSDIEDWPEEFDEYAYSRPAKCLWVPTSSKLSIFGVDLAADESDIERLNHYVLDDVEVENQNDFFHICATSISKDSAHFK